MTTTISTRELLHQFPKIKKGLAKGMHYRVLSHGKEVGEIHPPIPSSAVEDDAEYQRLRKFFSGKVTPKKLKKGELLKALQKISYHGDPNVTKDIDEIVYGI